MIGVLEKPVAAPLPGGQGQRKPATAFAGFLGSCPSAGGEAHTLANPFPFLVAGSGEQGSGVDIDGEERAIDVMEGGLTIVDCNSGAWLAEDAATISPSIQPATAEMCTIEGGAAGEKGSVDPLLGNDAITPVRDAVHMPAKVGQGQEEWVLRPWRLQAGLGLSYMSGNSTPRQTDGNVLTAPAMRIGVSQILGTQSIDVVGERASSGSQEKPLVYSAHGMAMLLNGGDNAGSANLHDPAGAGRWKSSAWIHWAQRMLRWNGGAIEGEDTVAWVRDFFLDADEVPGLVASLHAFSAGQGISLSRIMVNGREAWAAAGYSQHMERKGDGR